MARVLFFLQLIVALVILPLTTEFAATYGPAGWVFLAVVVFVPLAAAWSVHGAAAVLQALRDAWSPRALGPRSQTSVVVWVFLAGSFPIGGALGGLAAAASVLAQPAAPAPGLTHALTWGLFCLVWGFLGLLISAVLQRVVRRLSQEQPPLMTLHPSFGSRFALTAREVEAAQAVLDGLTYRDAAAKLFISPSTLKSHLLSVYQKTGAGNKIELLRLVEVESRRIHQKADGPQAVSRPS